MSLFVKIVQFQLPKPKLCLIGKVEFRGVKYSTNEVNSDTNIYNVNQNFVWPVARRATEDEILTVILCLQTNKLLLKSLVTSSASSSSTNSPFNGGNKIIGRYSISLQGVIERGKLKIYDQLVDSINKSIDGAFIELEVEYKSPDDEDGNFVSRNVVQGIGDNLDKYSDDDDKKMLLDVEENIANLERTLATKTATRVKKKNILKRMISRDDEDKERQTPTSSRKITIKSVRHLMKLGKYKRSSLPNYSSGHESSTDDEARALMPLNMKDCTTDEDIDPGETDDMDGNMDSLQTNASNDQQQRDTNYEQKLIITEDCEEKSIQRETMQSNKLAKITAREQLNFLKSQDFQVCVTIIEARQLPGLNMDPVVCIEIGDQKKYTSVKESTNCPYYNEYFVFDFRMPPVMLFDKIITLSVIHSRRFLRSGQLVGSFKLDLKTVYDAQDHQFYHKWAVLTDPEDFISGPKGYLKCDIGIIGKGDTVKVPQKSEKDPDDIEANLLLPDGVPIERQRTRFIIKIYRADGLPRMNSSIMANVKRALTGEPRDLVSPYVQVSFAGLTGKTSVKKSSYAPVWNEQLVFTEMFPPLCQRIKIQLKDDDPMKPSVIGTHYIDLKQISNDGDKGFLPTFGPSFIYLYGSPRDYSIINQLSNLNSGLGEGVSFRARLLMAIRTEVNDNFDLAGEKNVELEPTYPISENSYSRNEEFFLFSTIFEASLIDKKLAEKSIYFEMSIGNYGNGIDGHNETHNESNLSDDEDMESIEIQSFNSTTTGCKPLSHDKEHFYLPYWDYKPCMDVRCIFPELQRRLYNSNMLSKVVNHLDENLIHVNHLIEEEDQKAEVCLKTALDELATNASKYVQVTRNMNIAGVGAGKTKLDKERMKLCERELESIGGLARNLKALVTKNSLKERFKTAQMYLKRLKCLVEDPQHALPDVFIWLVANGKRVCYHRFNVRDLIYSPIEEESGGLCGKLQTIFLKLPGKLTSGRDSWTVQAKLSMYIWLGLLKYKKESISGLPIGYDLSQEIRNIERPRAIAPTTIHYLHKHVFQLRAHLYQARSLIASDASGLSDPFAVIHITEYAQKTQVIEETLSPTWDELLVFNEILVYGVVDDIRKNPPVVVIEIYDQDKMGKSEFIGRTTAIPKVHFVTENYVAPSLEWYDLSRGMDNAGELLAAFELIESNCANQIILPDPKRRLSKSKIRQSNEPNNVPTSILYPVPRSIRPHLTMFRIEVLFWGLRDLKRIHFMSVDRPRIDVECSGKIINSGVIQNAKKNPNFPQMIKYLDLELPTEENYGPPITIRCVDCRPFGRFTLVGTHQIFSIHKYIHDFKPKDSRFHDIIGGQIILSEASDNLVSLVKEKVKDKDKGRQSFGDNYGSTLTTKSRIQPQNRSISVDEEDHDNSKDWWTKYFCSYEKLIDDTKGACKKLPHKPVENSLKTKGNKIVAKLSPKHKITDIKVEVDTKTTSLCHIYPDALENQVDFNSFTEWLHSFPLYRGKKTGDSSEDDQRTVGFFKGALQIYRLNPDRQVESVFGPLLPANDPMHVLVRIYIVKATDLHPMDLNGKADPYVALQLGSKRISDKENYISKQLNPVFGKCFEIEAIFPQDSMLTIQILDWDLVGADDLIGETKIDLENRFYSKHRATCGISSVYEESGYNRWRDPMKPTQILSKLCKDNKLECPHYFQDHVTIGRYTFTFKDEDVYRWNGPTTCKNRDEHLALAVLHRWQEIPVGCKIVPEHIEARSLYNPDKPGIEQGKLEMWIDMFPMDMPLPGPPVDISPRKPKSYELRVVIWNTDEVVLEDDAFFTGEKMSDIYVKGWLKGPQDVQSTDIHYRSLTGEGNFNWRFIFPFDYLAAEERIVISRKESLFSWDETEVKIPPRLELQVWDADHFSADDFLGAISLNLNRFPRGAKSSKLCTLEMLNLEGVPTVNIFKQKRVRGWWPFFVKKVNDEIELTGKVEAEICLLTKEEAEQNPAGYGRNEPDSLEKPNRPDASFMWFLNPLKSIRYIVWHNYKWAILKGTIILVLAILLLLFFYAIPGYTVKKMLGA